MRVYCTYFDHHYLPRGLALYESLCRAGGGFELWVLCLSDACRTWLENQALPGLRLVHLPDLEAADPELLAVKPTRTIVEYYFTSTPCLVRYVLNQADAVDLVTYLDSDLYFFRDPEPVFDEIGDRSVAIIPHRFGPAYRHLESTGIYNVGWVTFRRDAHGLACLNWWRDRCLEWCYDRAEEGRYGDQKYLDQWPERFQGVAVLKNKGANLAPWNLGNFTLSHRAGRVWVEEDELVFFHYHGFRQITPSVYAPNIYHFRVKPTRLLREQLFLPYWQALRRAQSQIARTEQSLLSEGLRDLVKQPPNAAPARLIARLWGRIRERHRLLRCLLSGKYLSVPKAQRQTATAPTPTH